MLNCSERTGPKGRAAMGSSSRLVKTAIHGRLSPRRASRMVRLRTALAVVCGVLVIAMTTGCNRKWLHITSCTILVCQLPDSGCVPSFLACSLKMTQATLESGSEWRAGAFAKRGPDSTWLKLRPSLRDVEQCSCEVTVDWPDTTATRDTGQWFVSPYVEYRIGGETLSAEFAMGDPTRVVHVGPLVQPTGDSWTILPWAGDWRYGTNAIGGVHDELVFHRAYPLAARVLNGGEPRDGVHVTWVSRDGQHSVYRFGPESTCTWSDGDDSESGIALAYVVLAADDVEDRHEVVCSLDNGKTAKFNFYCLGPNDLDEPDPSLVPPGRTWTPLLFEHRLSVDTTEWPADSIFPGDGLINTSDLDAEVMDVNYTIDCQKDGWLEDSLETVAAKTDSIFRTAGVRARCVKIRKGLIDFNRGFQFTNIHDMRDLLRKVRETNQSEFRGRGCGAVAAVLGGRYTGTDETLAGQTVSFEATTDCGSNYTSVVNAMHLGSSSLSSRMVNLCLDSCGVIIFTQAESAHCIGRSIHGSDVVALDLAHELGHALGLMHTPGDSGLMCVDPYDLNNPRNQYDHFHVPHELNRLAHNLINLRQVLGREVVTIARRRLVRP